MWIDELHPQVRQRIVGRAPNVQHPLELKNAAVIELCNRKTSAQEIAQKLAVCRSTLYNWKNQLLGRETPASMTHHNHPPSAPDLTVLERQAESLRHDNRKLKLENDLLKKANELLKNCWDNACSETLFGSLKVERLYEQRFKTRRAAKDEAIAWLLCYNRTRLHSTLAYISPVQFEQNWLANQPKQANL